MGSCGSAHYGHRASSHRCRGSYGIFYRFSRPFRCPVDSPATMKRKGAVYLSSRHIRSYLFNHRGRQRGSLLPSDSPDRPQKFGRFDMPSETPVMVKTARAFVSVSMLRPWGVTLRGPFHTLGRNVPFSVENDFYAESELVASFGPTESNRQGIQAPARHIESSGRVVRP